MSPTAKKGNSTEKFVKFDLEETEREGNEGGGGTASCDWSQGEEFREDALYYIEEILNSDKMNK